MARVKGAEDPRIPEDYLRLAIGAVDAAARARYARAGLASPHEILAPDTQVLLLRQLYLAHLEAHRFRQAAEVAQQMTAVGPLADIAHHDAARAFNALGELEEAIREQRLAVRHAPVARRSFHLWGLATFLQFARDFDGALEALEKAERWAKQGRPLFSAHRAYVCLERGDAVEGLDTILEELARSRSREGYGQFLLGMLRHHMGDQRRAAVHLRAFVRRNASLDEAKALTLREELRRARKALNASSD